MKNKIFYILVLIWTTVLVGVFIGGTFQTINSYHSTTQAFIKEQINERYKTIEQERKLYKAVYYSSGKEKVFYFQTNKNPFDIAEEYLPDEWHDLLIQRSKLIE